MRKAPEGTDRSHKKGEEHSAAFFCREVVMRIPKTWVSLITKKVIAGIVSKQMVTPGVPMGKLLAEAEELILGELMAEDRLNEEVREILRKHSPEIEHKRLDYRKLFELTKQKIVKERNLIL